MPEVRIRDATLFHGFDLVPRLAAIRAPTLVLTGRHDLYGPPSQAARMQSAIPDSELVVFAESAHYPFAEEPAAFQAAVRGWLARHPDPVSGIQATWSAR